MALAILDNMDLFPLFNSLRIAFISSVITFTLGIFFAYKIKDLNHALKGVLDVLLTLPLVLPPTVIGFFILRIFGPNSLIGSFLSQAFDIVLLMNWYSAIIATVVVTFPLMYRSARAAFEAFDEDLKYAAQTLGRSDSWIFFHVILPNSKEGIISGAILAFARALGEYGATSMVAGYIPKKTATISTTVYHLWRIGQEDLAYRWVGVNLVISFVVLVLMNLVESKEARK